MCDRFSGAIALLPIHVPGDAYGKGEALRTLFDTFAKAIAAQIPTAICAIAVVCGHIIWSQRHSASGAIAYE